MKKILIPLIVLLLLAAASFTAALAQSATPEPTAEATESAAEETAPAAVETAPAAVETAPAAVETAPAAVETAPAAEATTPAEEETAPATEGIVPTTVTYAEVDEQPLILDVYEPESTGGGLLPAVILVHGGAGKFGDRSAEADRAQGLAANGYVAFNIEYRLLQDDGSNAWPAALDDAQLAVRWIRANAEEYNVDPERICSLGHSFGGQVAALLGVRDTSEEDDLELGEYSSKVACVVWIAGGLDAMHPFLDDLVDVEMALYGGAPSQSPEIHLDASPVAQVDADTVPFLIFHGTNDENTSVEEARKMVDALHDAGVEVVYVEYPDATHFYWISYFEITGSWDTVAAYTLAFLADHLQPEE